MSTSLVSNQGVEPVASKPSKSDLYGLIEMLELSDLQKHFMRSRWLEQVTWMEGKAGQAKKRYTTLRLTSIIGGVLVPILISLNFNDQKANDVVRGISIGLGGVVAISSAVEEFFHYGERWRHYRRTVESLKIQGWQFSQLSEPYRSYENHEKAFPVFVTQVENILQHDVEVYVTKVEQEQKDGKEKSEQQLEQQSEQQEDTAKADSSSQSLTS